MSNWHRFKKSKRPCNVEIHGEPDGQGRQPFTVTWQQDGEQRGQVFFDVLSRHIEVAGAEHATRGEHTGSALQIINPDYPEDHDNA